MTETRNQARHTNRLLGETSPYLLQHAHNPVNWYPWGEEALERARTEDRPILLSVGYSACHWCHVMERESFENERIADIMNRHFVCIKVDREERPDLDEIYMAATQALNGGQGGWPMTVFLTPDQQPFFAGTYFPPEDRYGRPGFATVLTQIADAWEKNREALKTQGAGITEHLRRQTQPAAPLAVGAAEMDAAAGQFAQEFDAKHGGFGHAPKFPPAAGLSFLLRHHRRSGDERDLEMVRKTLDAMARGGMYDQIGGGFARYSTDERWLVPHFEKMLYDNALLAKVYLEGYQVTGDLFYRRVAAETLDYILREMTSPEGGFYSATDADSEGVEGKFFVWTPSEIAAVLGKEEARLFCAYYDITEAGNWEGKSIPNTPRSLKETAVELGLSPESLQRSLKESLPKVYEARRRRVPPALDDKILTAWNGMMIEAMAEGFRVLDDSRYRQAAERAARFLLTRLVRPDGGLLRTYRAGKSHLSAYLDDYAWLCEALVDLYECGGAASYLSEAERLAERLLADFGDDDGGGFFSTALDHEELILRHKEGIDGATPSGNSVAACALARLSFHLDREDFRDAATRAVMAYGRLLARYPRAFTRSLSAVDLLLEGPLELALIGNPGDAGFKALRRELAGRYVPNRIIAHHDPAAGDPPPFPLLEGKGLAAGRAALYVCRDFTCRAPITDPTEVGSALSGAAKRPEERRAVGAVRQEGHATVEGTAARAARFAATLGSTAYGPLGSSGLTVSRLGFGGYRVNDETPVHREALEKAVAGGVNLIDTSTNYTDGGSERLVGAVLRDLVSGGNLRREEMVVISKIGYVQGGNLALAREREAAGRAYPQMVKYTEDCWHCIHPEFLEDQLAASRDRLGLQTLDVCLLHNPEYFLSDARQRGSTPLEELRTEFYRRLAEAFRFLEGQVDEGAILWYGVSSNTAVSPAADPEATSLTRMIEAARRAGGREHHFRVLQLPMNLFEAGGALERNNGRENGQTVLEAAAREGIGVLVNRPLNALVGEGMLRLADVRVEGAEIDPEAQRKTVAELEEEYRREIAPAIETSAGSEPAENFFRWAEQLDGLSERIRSLEHWQQIEEQAIFPRLLQAIRALDRALTGEMASRWSDWRGRYLPEVQRLLGACRRQAGVKSQHLASAVSAAVDPLLPAERRGETLSRKALWVPASTPGVSSVLNGMRAGAYVEDAAGILRWPPLPAPLPVYEALQHLDLAG